MLRLVRDHHRIHTHTVDGAVAVTEEAQIAAHTVNPHILQEHIVAVEIATEMVVKVAYRLPIGNAGEVENGVLQFEIDLLASHWNLHQVAWHRQIVPVESAVGTPVIEHLSAVDTVAEMLQFCHIADDERIVG